MLYKKANCLKYDVVIEEELKELLFQKGVQLLEQGECNDFLEGTQYENFSPSLQTSLLKIYQKLKGKEINKEAVGYYVRAQSFI